MDITVSRKKIVPNKFINGETVNYGVCFFAVSFLLIVLKQLFKIAFGMPAGLSVGISAAICAAVLFIFEKKFVFTHGARGSLIKQILLYIFRCAVDFGFYKIASFVFGNILHKGSAFVFLFTFFIYIFFNYYFDRLLVFDVIYDASKIKGGKCFKTVYSNRYVLAAMLLTGAGIGFTYLVFQLFPFGDVTVMRMDLYHQYGPLYCELFDRVVNGKAFIYSWYSGGGSSFIGNYFNYLSSPLSFIIFLFDRKEMPFAITVMVALKAVLSAGAFSYYLKKSVKSHSFPSAAFASFYAFCSYFLAYYWNIMWIDGMILFPLIILGIEKIINERKPVLYIASLTLLLYSTYYIGFMVCIFSIVYYIAYFAMTSSPGDRINPDYVPKKKYSLGEFKNSKMFNTGTLFATSSILCGLLCAVSLIPVFFILRSSSATSDSFPSSMESYFDILDLISSHLASLETTIRSSGDDVLPNVYCSVLTIILLPLFIANRNIKLKEKGVYVLLVIFFVFSFNNNYANFIWHAFHFPNDLPYRFSFMYSFILLIMAFKTLKRLDGIDYRDIAFSGMGWLFTIIILQKYQTAKFTDFTLYLTITFVIIWTGVLLLIKKERFSKLILGITVFSVAFCEIIIADPASYLFAQKFKDYMSNYDNYTEAIDFIESNDDSFYKTEICELDTRMDPCLYGYRGISTFSSMAYEDYSLSQHSLGMAGNRVNSYTYNTQTPIYNMMFNIKYLIHSSNKIEPSADYFNKIHETKNKEVDIFENKYNLPIAFEVSSDIEKWEIEEGEPFIAQQEFINKATGVNDIFVPVEYVKTEFYDVECDEVIGNGTYFFDKSSKDIENASVDITIKSPTDSNVYVYIYSPEVKNINYYMDEDESENQNIESTYLLDLGKHKKGEEITISVDCGSSEEESSYFDIYAYGIDKEKFEAAYELLQLGALNITSFSDTQIEGNISAGYNGYLYTSIPYDEGWTITIDGKKAELEELGNAQLACKISKGEHKVKLSYSPKGFNYGLLITLVTWGGVILFLLLRKRIRKKKKIVENV